jgi:uncharacterized protein (TIGR03663 family)
MSARFRWFAAGILGLAFVLRIVWLDLKPVHFDEGVNGWFVDQMTRQGYYHYDPTNFHGPLHFYVLFVSQTLLGRSVWALRLPVVLVSVACVGLMLAFRRYLDERACLIAALAMALSPGMIFYGRYAIHETELVFFLLLTAWGLAGLWRWGERRDLWATSLGITGLILTKETYIIHLVAFLLAVPCLAAYESASPSEAWPFGDRRFSRRDVLAAMGVCAGLVVFFYSGGLLDWPGPRTFNDKGEPLPLGSIAGLWETFGVWIATGTGSHGIPSGHEKAWSYWLELFARYEWPALVGLAAGLGLLAPRTGRVARYLAIYGLGALIGYSSVPYKTPWCVITLIWPFYFVFGLAVVRAAEWIDRWTAAVFAGVLGVFSLALAMKLNFHDYTDDREPYVYVQTFADVNKVLDPLRTLTRRDARNYHLRGHLILPEQYPWVWLLADFPRVDFPTFDQLPEPLDADFLVIDAPLVEQTEPLLQREYFTLPMPIRGNSDSRATLYLSTDTFAGLVPRETPKFSPGSAPVPVEPPDAR